MGLGPSVTLFGTVNPDFGQVEADPAEVNLSQFETLFADRRPFFTEGFQFLGGTRLQGGTRSTLFYTRRIGVPPRGRAEGDYIETPNSTTILGATKVTGRLASGLSIGALSALTAREFAKTFDTGTTTFGKTGVEPLTSFNVFRLQQEFGASVSTVGLMLTAVHRDVSTIDSLAQRFSRQAYTGGGNWNLHFEGGKYELSGELAFSFIEGKPGAIERVQRSSTHYFQRPDATHITLDTERTSLFGSLGLVRLRKKSGRHWLWEVRASTESPGFAPNDLALQFTSDDIDVRANLLYRETMPTKLFHNYEISNWVFTGWNYGAVRQYTRFRTGLNLTWANFTHTSLGIFAWTRATNPRFTRGGPLMGTGSGMNIDFQLLSSPAKRNSWLVNLSYTTDELGSWDYTIQGGLEFRPSDRWEFSVIPGYSRSVNARQYITALEGGGEATFGKRYIFSFTDRSTPSIQFRFNYALTPDLSLEVYAEPFAASGRFYDFGELPEAGSRKLKTYGSEGITIVQAANGTRTITDGEDSFSLSNHDFNVRSLRSNVVLRWEWHLGSTLFLVWQQDRSSSEAQGNLVGPRGLWDTLTVGGDNFIAIKVSNWLPID